MKKFMFSAVALVAFSFAGMAINKEKKIVLEEDCGAIYKSEKACWIKEGKTEKEAMKLARDAYYDCGKRNYAAAQAAKAAAFYAS